jgi:hypothetical protein
MDYRGQTAVLSAILVLVGMMFLVPVITGKALTVIHATAKGVCGPATQIHSCQFTLVGSHLDTGTWISQPTQSGTLVTWSTTGGGMGDEKGSVTYNVGVGQQKETAVLTFEISYTHNIGSNKCGVIGIGGGCDAGKGMNAEFTYDLRGK